MRWISFSDPTYMPTDQLLAVQWARGGGWTEGIFDPRNACDLHSTWRRFITFLLGGLDIVQSNKRAVWGFKGSQFLYCPVTLPWSIAVLCFHCDPEVIVFIDNEAEQIPSEDEPLTKESDLVDPASGEPWSSDAPPLPFANPSSSVSSNNQAIGWLGEKCNTDDDEGYYVTIMTGFVATLPPLDDVNRTTAPDSTASVDSPGGATSPKRSRSDQQVEDGPDDDYKLSIELTD